MRWPIFLPILLLCLSAIPRIAVGAQVTQVLADQVFILVAQEKENELQLDDRVCFFRDGTRVGCGLVVAATPKGAKVKITEQLKSVKTGDTVQKAGIEEGQTVSGSTPSTSTEHVSSDPPSKANILIGIKQSLTTANSFFNAQIATNPYVAFGIQANLLKIALEGTNKVQAIGGNLNIDFYSRGNFEGLWLDFGIGFDTLNAASTGIGGTSYAPMVMGQFGWRAKWALGLNIGIAACVQYYFKPFGISSDFDFQAIQPMLSADIGVKF